MAEVDVDVDGVGQSAPVSDLAPDRVWGMLESAPDGMLMTDEDGVILAVNRQVEAMFGYERSELLGRKIEILLPSRLHDAHRAHRTLYRAAPNVRGMGDELDLRAKRRDGTEFPVEVSLSPLTDERGMAIVASVRDVTEKRRASAHAKRVQAAIDAVHDGVFMFEPDTLRFVYANEGASQQVGYSVGELMAMSPLHIKPEFTREQFDALIAPLVAGDVDHLSFRTIHRHRSGRDVPVDIVLEHRDAPRRASMPVPPDEEVADALLVAIVRDVTDQVEVERRLALSEETFRTSFDNAPVGMAIAHLNNDGEHAVERVNASFAKMLGRSVDALVGVDFVDISHPDSRAWSLETVQEMLAGQRDALVTEQQFRRADGSYVWTLVHATVIERSDGMRTLTHIVDITDRRERQAERERLTTMEDRERIARDIHDLVIQRLFGAGMRLQAVIPEMHSEAAVTRTNETVDELDAAIRELRSAIFSLHQHSEQRSPGEEIVLAIDQQVGSLGFRPVLALNGPTDSIASSHAAELVAVLREALSNVARHSGASSVEVEFSVTDTSLSLRICDNGSGIGPTRALGNGIQNMRERALRLGGDFSVEQADSGGCELTWIVPR